jgi:hypothetical protein
MLIKEWITKEWITKVGLPARIMKNPSIDTFCGYVGFDEKSGFYKVHYEKLDSVVVHGGLTFSGNFDDSDLWWVGYDCAHSGDYSKFNPSGKIRDVDYCTKQCENLAKQLIDTPLDYLFRSKKMDKLPEDLHNKMIAWSITDSDDPILKEYFLNLENKN